MTAIWVDDVRPAPAGYDIHIKTLEGLVNFLIMSSHSCNGSITRMSFDHDMPEYKHFKNVYDVLTKVMPPQDLFNLLPPNNMLFVHSANPCGRENIKQFLYNLHKEYEDVNTILD